MLREAQCFTAAKGRGFTCGKAAYFTFSPEVKPLMISMPVLFTQLAVIFGYVLIGFAAGKLHIINPSERKYLTRLCSQLILPFTILSASSMEAGGELLLGFAASAVVMFLLYALTSAGVLVCMRGSDAKMRTACTGLATYSNATFLGLPLCRALFGDIAMLYNAALIVAFNVLFFTLQYSLFTGEGFKLRNLLTPPTVATMAMIVMLALGLHFPAPVQTVVSNTGAMITPISLMIIGVMVAESDLASVFREKRAYVITFVRNLLVPAATIAVLRFLPMAQDAKMCILVMMACPSAALTIIYAVQNDTEPEMCANTVLLSTLAFAVTLPAVIALAQLVL